MSRSKRLAAHLVVAVVSLLVAACGGSESAPAATFTTGGSEDTFGSPADPADADRIVEIVATDDFAFDPADVTVTAGETVTFRIANQGSLVHDFTLGDQPTQDEHEAEMAEMDAMVHDQPKVVTIPAGETMELTWTFTQAGTVLIGCHQPGHHAGGMKGQITVEA